jgi:regulation of enolase protein 1 (concanavalin A-like superfamily)
MNRTLFLICALASLFCVIGPHSAEAVDFRDDFETAHNFLTDGVTGTGWSGVYTAAGSGRTTDFLACNTADGGVGAGEFLRIKCNSAWVAGSSLAAPFLYKEVTGDFIATTRITAADAQDYNNAGLMVRMPNPTSGENLITAHASFAPGAPRHRVWSTVNNVRTPTEVVAAAADLNYYRIERAGSVFISTYSNDGGATWTEIARVTRADLAAAPYLEVGVFQIQGNSTTTQLAAHFDFVSITDPPQVKAVDFRDDFGTAHNFLTGGVTGTEWSGVFTNAGSGKTMGFLACNTADVGVAAGEFLRIKCNSAWVATANLAAPFLYKNVAGDFTATTRILTADAANYNNAGLMVRMRFPGPSGENLVTAHASFAPGAPRHRVWSTVNNVRTQTEVVAAAADLNYYRIVRAGSVFTSSYSNDDGATWTQIAQVTREDLAAEPYLQVGVFQISADAAQLAAHFDFVSISPPPSQGTVISIR